VKSSCLGIELCRRSNAPLAVDERIFAEKRNFCVITIQDLVEIANSVNGQSKERLNIWEAIHKTCGILSLTSCLGLTEASD
jgi:hypothetical protein